MERRAFGVFFILAALAAAVTAAEWKDCYFAAMKKFEAGNYQSAAKLYKEAIDLRDIDCVNCLREDGMFYTDYLPHYYLGLCQLHQGDYDGALKSLDRFEKSGLTAHDKGLGGAFLLQYDLARAKAASGSARQGQEAARPAGGKEPGKAEPSREALCVEVCSFYGIDIRLCHAGGVSPRFEAVYGEARAVLDVETLEVLDGRIPDRALIMVRDWASSRRHDIVAAWNTLGAGRRPAPLPPLR